MTTPQAMAPAPFFYYSPDPNPESRHHGHFRSHPGFQQQPMHMYPVVPVLPSTPIYSRPNSSSSGSQPPVHLQKVFTSMPSSMTPMASPQPMGHRPTIMLETEISEVDGSYYPSTPPLSTSGSVISSPGSCDLLQTPMNPMFSGLDGMQAKQHCEMDTKLEQFPNLDWTSCASPPMTPMYLQTQAPKVVSLNSVSSDLLSTASCPSLSPSPSPYARSVSSDDIDFCDPRNLTVGTVNSTLAPEYSALHTLCTGDEEERKFTLRGEAFVKSSTPAISPSSSFDSFNTSLTSSLSSFDDFSDLESEDDFVNGLVNLGGEQPAPQSTRSRTSSDALSLEESSFVCEDELADFEHGESSFSLPSPPDSCEDSDAHQHKRQKVSAEAHQPAMNVAADAQQASTGQQQSPSDAAQASTSSDAKNHSESNSGSDENAGSAPMPAPANRRGRKQSLTEDPSKTFVCDLCNRRFRRQEHLKRHYRSLHTQEKPFECHECGKKFSRSDNLAQHARTHGSGAIVMNLIDDPDAMAAVHPGFAHHLMGGGPMDGDYHTLGKVLFQVTAEIPGSASELSSDEGSDHGKKKRKRMD